MIFERAVKVPFKHVDDLASVWCEWAELELRNSYVLPISFLQNDFAP